MDVKASSGALVVIAAALGMSFGTAASALTLSQAATPAENPPSSYTEDVYVDSRGCIYVRASIGTTVNWVPRLSRDRETVVCGLTPSGTGAATAAPATAATTPVAPVAPVIPVAPAPVAQAPVPLEAAQPAPIDAPVQAAISPATLPAGQAPGIGAETASAVPLAARPPVKPAPSGSGAVSRTMDVTCPTAGASVRVNVGADTVRLRCPEGLSRSTSYLITHGNGTRSRVVARLASASPFDSADRASGLHTAAFGTVHGGTTAAVPGARWVQVGAFGVSGNATRAIAQLKRLGFGTATAQTRSGLTLVMAGPFNDASGLKRALHALRGYYPDAYTRG